LDDANTPATKADIEDLRGALKGDIEDLRGALKGDIEDLRCELKGDIADLRAELKGDIKGLRGELKGDITDLRAELKGDIAGLDQKFEQLKSEMNHIHNDIVERIHDGQTEILKAFYGYAQGNNKRVGDLETNEAGFRSRLATIEDRILEVERRLNIPPAA
jgi:DNA repair exonuclease SbcCD ATPase subunit